MDVQDFAKPFPLTRIQLKAALIAPKFERHIWGRGTGKTTGLIAPRSLRNILEMPRSCGAFIGATFQQLLTKTLPPVVAAWENMGLKRDVHFTIGRKPHAKLNFEQPLIPVLTHEYFIHFFNGSGIYLISQDRPGSANGLSLDWAHADEAKLLKKDRLFEELLPAIRGNRKRFGHLPFHGSTLFTSDMPSTKAGMWLLDEEQKMDRGAISLILDMQYRVIELEFKLLTVSPSYAVNIRADINKLKGYLNIARNNRTYFTKHSSWENVDILGEDTIKAWRRQLPPMIYRTSVMSERLGTVQNSFYPGYNSDKHEYATLGSGLLDISYNFHLLKENSCSYDSDLDRTKPLDIACDFGASINLIVVGQQFEQANGYREYRFLNSFYKLSPALIQDVVADFCNYYDSFPVKIVNFYYDHTAVGHFANIDNTYAQSVVAAFRNRDWKVNELYIGQALQQKERYLKWDEFLKSDGFILPLPKFHKINASYLITSIEQAEAEEGKDGRVQKRKQDEKNSRLNQATTTHHTDAADTLLMGKYVCNYVRSMNDAALPMFG
jgi:hypothetical protein